MEVFLAQPKEGEQPTKNKKQSELPENQTAWKSDNQGVKEHSSRLVKEMEMGSQGGYATRQRTL